MIGKFKTLAAAIALGASVLATPAGAEPTGESCSDCAVYNAKYSIKNTALFQIEYQFRWGNEKWRTVVLTSGARKTHSHSGPAPEPAVRFRQLDGSWSQIYGMSTHAVVVDPGYTDGTPVRPRKPKRYELIYNGDFQQIQLKRLVKA
jgi:hypothetical protein